MPKPRDIRGKIADLLALSSSSEPMEARATLLKARELMAKHKLTPEDCREGGSETVIREVLPIACTAMTNPWAVSLAATIAEHYCCEAFRQRSAGRKRVSVGLVGLEDDFQVCRQVILYAYERVMSYCLHIRCGPGESAAVCRERRNAYGWGFVAGLREAFERQEEEHQEWGLVMTVPGAVHDALSGMKRTAWGKVQRGHPEYKSLGYQDGKKFDPDRRALPKDRPA